MLETPENLAWAILLLPLLSAVLITLVTQKHPLLSAKISIAAIVMAFVVSCIFCVWLRETDVIKLSAPWLNVGTLQVDIGIQIDKLSLLMLLVVTGVGGAIHIYSYGYMRGDPGMSRYFASLSLFTFSMVGIVLANNFFEMFVFWELVGLSSYLLIGFWYEKASAADAAKKAFLTNRIGDFGFLLGIIMIWTLLGDFHFDFLEQRLTSNPGSLGKWASLVGVLIFCGAMGKSAQFPLHVWLPDAMEGPTPVSALIHAATMVAAGVYMLCRVFFLFTATQQWPAALSWLHGVSALDIIATIGGITSLLAAVIAVQQNDIKRILAYSTLSQLGYMIMAVGLASPTAAMYHLITHAFFKALLFLGAGSVIYALHHEQDIWKMGNLQRRMPITFWTFLLATLALAGVPPLSGFFSKDDILGAAYHHSVALFIVATIVAILTAFYMSRLFLVAFMGPAKSEAVDHAHESPAVMSWPLIVLAVPTVIAGFLGLDAILDRKFGVQEAAATGVLGHVFAPFNHSPLAALFGIGAVLFGVSAAWALYRDAVKDPLPQKLGLLARMARQRFYFDEIYNFLFVGAEDLLASFVDAIDRWVIAGIMVRGAHGTVEIVGRALRLFQTGNIQTYAFLLVVGAAILLFYVFRH